MEDSGRADDLLATLGRPYEELHQRFGSRHAELLAAIDEETGIRLVAESCGEARWTVSIAAADSVGVLAVIAGLFAARRIDIRNGDVFSLRTPPDSPPLAPGSRSGSRTRRPSRPMPRKLGKILDVFEVVTSAWVQEPFWTQMELELAELIELLRKGDLAAAVERVTLSVSESVSGASQPDEPLYPLQVSLENRDEADATELRLHAPDTPAFLFEFVNALTLLDVNIERVQIRTLYGEARDTFWVTDVHGRKIESPERLQELRVATALIKQFSHLLPRSANPAQALQQFTKLTSDVLRRPDWTATLEPLGSGDVLRTLADMMGVSSFLWEDFLRLQHENLFPVLADIPGLEVAKDRRALEEEFAAELAAAEAAEAARVLNRCKDREMFRIDLRHVTQRIAMDDFAWELTQLAEATIAATADVCWKALEQRFGVFSLPWCICGAGKLGGREMGYASDVELIFVCDPGEGANPELKAPFEHFARDIVKTIVARQNGVFEIDLRLRPFGESGPLTCTLETFRRYYAAGGQAQQFERMSLVKLRPLAGNCALGKELESLRDDFVYSGAPVDLANIRYLRERQVTELVRPGTINAKFSPGGLVDIEYAIQARQIERGAAHPEIRTPNTQDAITRLAGLGELETDLARRTTEAYRFLRRLIDALRVVRGNAKDVAIPSVATREFDYLSRRLGYPSPESLQRDLDHHMAVAHELWI